MSTETIVVNSTAKYSSFGSQVDANGKYSDFVDSGVSAYERSRRVKVSISSPKLWRKVVKYVPYKPRSGRTPTMPRQPFFTYPRMPVLKPRRPSQGDRSWSRSLSLYKQKLLVRDAKVKSGLAHLEQRMAIYRIRLAKFVAYSSKVVNGVPVKLRTRILSVPSEWHPFSQLQSFDTGAIGHWIFEGRAWHYYVPYPYTYGYKGDITAKQDIVKNGSWPISGTTSLISNATAAANSLALNRFHEALTNEHIHVGQVIAERAQTIGMLADAVKRLASFLTNFTPKKAFASVLNRFSKKGGRQTANDYLAFKFGAEPLMGDVKGAAEALARMTVEKLDTFLVRVKGSATKTESQQYSYVSNNVTYNVTVRVEVHVRYVCEYGLENVLSRELSMLGLINPAEIAWELLPWSFLIDWIYPFGTYLRHISNDTGLVFLRGTRSVRTVSSTSVHAVQRGVATYLPQYWGADDWRTLDWTRTRGNVDKVRTVLTKSPYVQVPVLRNPLSFTHVAESLALLYQKRFK